MGQFFHSSSQSFNLYFGICAGVDGISYKQSHYVSIEYFSLVFQVNISFLSDY